MKKLILAMVLIGVLVGSILGGLAMAAPGATLSVDPGIGDVGTQVKVSGTNWTPGVLVNIYWDVEDDVHQLATIIPSDKGRFNVLFNMGATSIGVYDVIAVQGTTQASDTFTLEATQPVDERVWGVISDISNEIAAIEGKLDDPAIGLAEIKAEVANIETTVGDIEADLSTVDGKVEDIHGDLDNPAYGLAEIKAEVANIESTLANLPRIEKFSSGQIISPPGGEPPGHFVVLLEEMFNELRHINITLSTPTGSSVHRIGIIADFDGDGDIDFYVDYPEGVSSYEFEAFGFRVQAFNDGPINDYYWVNAVTIY